VQILLFGVGPDAWHIAQLGQGSYQICVLCGLKIHQLRKTAGNSHKKVANPCPMNHARFHQNPSNMWKVKHRFSENLSPKVTAHIDRVITISNGT
jgi:hypothetical protein